MTSKHKSEKERTRRLASRRRKEPVECSDSPTSKHSFMTDWEYDPQGRCMACEYCGCTKAQAKADKALRDK